MHKPKSPAELFESEHITADELKATLEAYATIGAAIFPRTFNELINRTELTESDLEALKIRALKGIDSQRLLPEAAEEYRVIVRHLNTKLSADDHMKMYVVRFRRGGITVPIYSGLQPTTHAVTAKDFKDTDLSSDLDRLFNGEGRIDCGLILEMTPHGPILNRNTVRAPIYLDGVLLKQDPVSHQMPKIPLGVPAEHAIDIGHVRFALSVLYVD